MNKAIILSLFAACITLTSQSQIAQLNYTEGIPETEFILKSQRFDPKFDNSFVQFLTHGRTIANLKSDLYIIDSKSLKQIQKIEYPSYKDFQPYGTSQNPFTFIRDNDIVDMKQNLVFFYSSKSGDNTALSVIKMNESLRVAHTPEFLFEFDNANSFNFLLNDTKDLCIFSYYREFKKIKKTGYYYRIYDNNLKLIKADSIIQATESEEWYSASIFESGFGITTQDGQRATLSITDLKSNKTTKYDFSSGKGRLSIEKIRLIEDNKLVVLSNYYLESPKKEITNGIRKTIITLNGKIEENIDFDHVPAGKGEIEKQKYVSKAIITESGACYAMICQFNISFLDKYELMCIENRNNTWKKQLPLIPKSNNFEMLFSNGFLFVCYLDFENKVSKIDINNYVYGDPRPAAPMSVKEALPNISILKIDRTGQIQQERFFESYYNAITAGEKQFVCFVRGLNRENFSNCKFLNIDLNDH
jgi:hypothetical protein